MAGFTKITKPHTLLVLSRFGVSADVYNGNIIIRANYAR